MSELVKVIKVDNEVTKSKDWPEDLKFMTSNGISWVENQYPGSKYRPQCDCCYGEGPDITTANFPNGDHYRIEFYVDFDFKMPKDEE